MWSALQQRLADRRPFAWVGNFEPDALTADGLTLRPRPGRRQTVGFATPQRLTLLEAELAAVTGKRLRIRVQQPPDAPSPADAPSPDNAADPQRDALNLPLVKRVFDVFPDATIINVEREDEQST